MRSQNSKKKKSRSAAASAKVSDSSGASTEVSRLMQSYLNVITEYTKEMHKEIDQLDEVARKEYGLGLLTAVQDSNRAIDGKKWPIMKVSKRKPIEAWMKEHFQLSGEVVIAKFFGVLRRLRKKYKTIKKKSIQGIKNISKGWKLAIRPILLFAKFALLVGAVVAMVVPSGPMVPTVLGIAHLVPSIIQFLQPWLENLFKEHEKKLCNEGSTSGSLRVTSEQNEYFTIIVKKEFLNVRKIMERFTGAYGDLEQLTNSSKRMMEDGGKALEKKKSQIKKKLTN